eukprot:222505-Amphidinium_carterae.1
MLISAEFVAHPRATHLDSRLWGCCFAATGESQAEKAKDEKKNGAAEESSEDDDDEDDSDESGSSDD